MITRRCLGFAASLAAAVLILKIAPAIAQTPYSDGFVFPVLGISQTDPKKNTKNPLFDGWGGNGVGVSLPAFSMYGHLGQDYYIPGHCGASSDTTAGKPVYAVSNGRVVVVIDNPATAFGWDDEDDHGWGPVVIIEHILPSGFNTDASTMLPGSPHIENPKKIYSLYGHLKKGSTLFEVGQTVEKGEQIAQIGTGRGEDNKWDCSHLHFELKNSTAYTQKEWYPKGQFDAYCGGEQGVGFGYSGFDGKAPGRYVPAPFIINNLVLDKALAQVEGTGHIVWLQNEKWYHVASTDIIANMATVPKWSFANLVPISGLEQYADSGKSFATTDGSSTGLLIKVVGTHDIYQVTGSSAERIPSPEEFNNRGLDWADIIEVSQDVFNMFTPTGGNPGIDVGEGALSEGIRTAIIDEWTTHSADLGNPTDTVKPGTSSLTGTTGFYQTFSNGSVQYMNDGPNAGIAFTLYGAAYRKWGQLRHASGDLGFPAGNRQAAVSSYFGSTGEYQPFEGGSIQFHGTEPKAVTGQIYTKWGETGYADSPLGFPIGEEELGVTSGFGTTGSYQRFEGGTIQIVEGTSFAVYGLIYEEWGNHGYAGPSGYSLGDEIEHAQNTWTGFPVSDRYTCEEGECQDFEGGKIHSDGVTAEFVNAGPTDLNCDLFDDSALCNWENNVQSEGVNLYRSSSPAEIIAVLGPDDSTYLDHPIDPASPYTYFLRGFSFTAESPISNKVHFNRGLDTGPWPMYKQNARQTGQGLFFGPTYPTEDWLYDAGEFRNQPAVASDGTIYVAPYYEENLLAINPDGSPKWTRVFSSDLRVTPTIGADGTIYTGSRDRVLYAINPEGSIKWQTDTYERYGLIDSPVIGSDGRLFASAWTEDFGRIYAFMPEDGSIDWSLDLTQRPLTTVLGGDGTIYVGTYLNWQGEHPSMLVAINPDGTPKWEVTLPAGYYDLTGIAVGADETIYCVSNLAVYAFDSAGTPKWEYSGGIRCGPSIGPDGTILAASSYEIHAIRPDGTVKWKGLIPSGTGDIAPNLTVDRDGTVYCQGETGALFAFDSDGNQKWKHVVWSYSSAAPVISGEGRILIATRSGGLHALKQLQGIYGTVEDISTGQPLSAVAVSSSPSGETQSNVWGIYSLDLEPGLHEVTFSKSGYSTLNLSSVVVAQNQASELKIELSIPGPLNIVTTTLAPGETGIAYSERIRITGGAYPYTYSIPYGILPEGLSLDTEYGGISGVPSSPGTFTFGFRVTDGEDIFAQREFSIEVTEPLSITTTSPLPRATRGECYIGSIAAMGGTPPYTFSTLEGWLPSGLILSADANIVGTPSSAGSYQFTVQVQDSSGRTDQKQFSVEVDNPLSIGTWTLADGIVAVAYNQTLEASGGNGAYWWEVYSGMLPDGLFLDGLSGQITGTPSEPTYGTIVVAVHDEAGRVTYRDFMLQVVEALQIITPVLPDGLVGSPYSEAIQTRGGVGGFNFSYVGQLPEGLSLNSSTGIISGTPTIAGYTNVSITVSDSTYPTNQVDDQTLGIGVYNRLTILYSAVLPAARKGQEITDIVLSVGGGPSPYTWAIVDGYLPEGIYLHPTDGAIWGTPMDRGDFLFAIEVTDSAGTTATKEFVWHISDTLSVVTGAIPDGAVGTPYSFALEAEGGQLPYWWRIKSGTLPDGLAFNNSTGAIYGTPTSRQTYSFTVEVSDKDSPVQTADKTYIIDILDDLFIYTLRVPNGRLGEAYTATVRAALGDPPYNWSLYSGVLPPGLSLVTSASSCEIEGTPTDTGTYVFTLQVTDIGLPMDTAYQEFTVEIYGDVTIETTSLATAQNGTPYSDTIVVSGGQLPYTWSVIAGNLPPGLSLNSTTGHISGITSLVNGQSSEFRVRVCDSGRPYGCDERTFLIQAIDPLDIVTQSIQGALQKSFYQATLEGYGGISPYHWSIQEGSLPEGLTLDPDTAAISGTPVKCGPFDFTVRLEDSAPVQNTTVRAFGLNVVCCNDYEISGQVLSEAGVLVTLGGAGSGTTTTDAQGYYSFEHLTNGTYSVTPSKDGYLFGPASRQIVVNNLDVGGVNFERCVDEDEDGFSPLVGGLCGPMDCDDQDGDINPNAIEICDGIDNNCVNGIDEAPDAAASCNNGLYCDGIEYCNLGVCQPGLQIDCSHLDDQCNLGVCDEDADSCEAQPTNEGGGCDDGLFCTGTDTCQSGECTGAGDPCAGEGLYCDEESDQCIEPEFSLVSPMNGAQLSACPMFEWTAGTFDLYQIYLVVPILGKYYTIPVWWGATEFDLSLAGQLWNYVSLNTWAAWAVLGVNTATSEWEVTGPWWYRKVAP